MTSVSSAKPVPPKKNSTSITTATYLIIVIIVTLLMPILSAVEFILSAVTEELQ
jgi:hypothetical protein